MVAIQSNLFDIEPSRADSPRNCSGGLFHIADVLDELLQQLPSISLEIEPGEAEQPVAVSL